MINVEIIRHWIFCNGWVKHYSTKYIHSNRYFHRVHVSYHCNVNFCDTIDIFELWWYVAYLLSNFTLVTDELSRSNKSTSLYVLYSRLEWFLNQALRQTEIITLKISCFRTNCLNFFFFVFVGRRLLLFFSTFLSPLNDLNFPLSLFPQFVEKTTLKTVISTK